MSHYDSCREAEKLTNSKKEAHSYYEAELNQLGKAVELIKALANGYSVDYGNLDTTPKQICDRWLQDNGYECESSRAAQRDIKLAKINAEIERLQKEREAL